jgi:hypothetical protein
MNIAGTVIAGVDLVAGDRPRAVCLAIDQLIARRVSNGRLIGASVFRLSKLLDPYGDATFTEAVAEVLSGDSRNPHGGGRWFATVGGTTSPRACSSITAG